MSGSFVNSVLLSLVLVCISLGQHIASHHNYDEPFDVNGDGSVTPADVIIVINMLNARRGHPDFNRHDRFYYFDVNDDGVLSPIDALLIINYLNGRSKRDRGVIS